MKAIQIKDQKIRVYDVEAPAAPKAGEILLKVLYVGFCGSDLNTYRGRNLMALNPVIPGHEIGAVIECVGANVPGDLRKGLVVTCNPYTNCGHCAACRNGRYNACEHNETLGVQRDGAMREYITLPWEKVIPAKELTPRTCALIEPMSVGFHAVNRGQVTDADTVMVIGCGMVGMGAIVRASLRGATVIAADIDDHKLELAKTMGASYTVNTISEDVHAKLQQITHGDGPDVVIEAVGSSVTYQIAVNEVAFTGRVVCIGYAKGDVLLPTGLFVKKELDVRGSRNATPKDFQAVIRYLRRGTCPVDKLISKDVTLEEAPEAMKWWDENPGKVFRIVVDMTNSGK